MTRERRRNRRTRETYPAIRVVFGLWSRRSLGVFLTTLARFHFDVGRGHCVSDVNFIANFDVTCDFGVRVAINLPTVFHLLHHDHRIINFQTGPVTSYVFAPAKATLLKARLAAANKLNADFIFIVTD